MLGFNELRSDGCLCIAAAAAARRGCVVLPVAVSLNSTEIQELGRADARGLTLKSR